MTGIKFLIGSQGENIFCSAAGSQDNDSSIPSHRPLDLMCRSCYFFNPNSCTGIPICESLPTTESVLCQLLQSFQKAIIARERKKKKKEKEKKRKITSSHINTKILGKKTKDTKRYILFCPN